MRKTGEDRNCQQCGIEFHVPAWRLSRNGEGRFCSMACLWVGRAPREKTVIHKICEKCGCDYSVPPNRSSKTRFCSKTCQGSALFVEAAELRRAGNRSKPKMSSEELKAAKKKWDASDYEKHKSKRLSAGKEKYAANREQISAKRKKFAKENPEKITSWSRMRRAKHGEKLRANRREHYRQNKPVYVANARKREARIKMATPPWADLKKIEAFYVEAARLTIETGIKHHVDHIFPLKGKTSCGLHVENNLQILSAVANLRKSNKIIEAIDLPLSL